MDKKQRRNIFEEAARFGVYYQDYWHGVFEFKAADSLASWA